MATLPHTRGASKQHSLRVYLQIQQWLGHHPPNGVQNPVTTNEPVAKQIWPAQVPAACGSCTNAAPIGDIIDDDENLYFDEN
ncbi:hypothetical protein JTB14_017718 [Gonioctena quinquepunctata]|nr:hypothetical protein JTB14_017718 [Gonioctena quinquepunctata]